MHGHVHGHVRGHVHGHVQLMLECEWLVHVHIRMHACEWLAALTCHWFVQCRIHVTRCDSCFPLEDGCDMQQAGRHDCSSTARFCDIACYMHCYIAEAKHVLCLHPDDSCCHCVPS